MINMLINVKQNNLKMQNNIDKDCSKSAHEKKSL